MISEELFGQVLGVITVLFLYRYAYIYLSKVSKVVQRINFMNNILRNVDDPSTFKITFENFKPAVGQFKDEKLIKKEFLNNRTYNEYHQKYENLENYKQKFWALEGRMYLVVIILFAVLFLI